MAGHSRRFQKAGFTTPKPFIDINGKSMIERVVQMFSPQDEFVFICNKEHLEDVLYLSVLKKVSRRYQIVPVDPHEGGPVYSALSADDYIFDKSEPVILTYCDFTMQWDYRGFLQKAAQYEGAIAVFKGFQPASMGDTYYAYLRANANMEMVELREKKSFTNNRLNEYASTGVYYVDQWQTFKKYAKEIMADNNAGLNEAYCSLIYNPMVRDGLRVCLCEVEKFICWGTPEDFMEYQFWSRYFSRQGSRQQAYEVAND